MRSRLGIRSILITSAWRDKWEKKKKQILSVVLCFYTGTLHNFKLYSYSYPPSSVLTIKTMFMQNSQTMC